MPLLQWGGEFRKENSISPVIGTVLLVALVVIVVALASAVLIGMTGNVGGRPAFTTVDIGLDDSTIYVKHKNGEAVEAGQLRILIDGVDRTKDFSGAENKFDAGSIVKCNAGTFPVDLVVVAKQDGNSVWLIDSKHIGKGGYNKKDVMGIITKLYHPKAAGEIKAYHYYTYYDDLFYVAKRTTPSSFSTLNHAAENLAIIYYTIYNDGNDCWLFTKCYRQHYDKNNPTIIMGVSTHPAVNWEATNDYRIKLILEPAYTKIPENNIKEGSLLIMDDTYDKYQCKTVFVYYKSKWIFIGNNAVNPYKYIDYYDREGLDKFGDSTNTENNIPIGEIRNENGHKPSWVDLP